MQLKPETGARWSAQASTPIDSSAARYLGTEREPNYMLPQLISAPEYFVNALPLSALNGLKYEPPCTSN